VLHQIGAGSLGPVFRAEDPASQTPVVIKVLRLNLTPERARIVADELAALQDRVPAHPGIAPIVKAGIRDVEPFVVSAFMPGDSLDVTLRDFGPSGIADALPRLVQIAAGLDFCADASIWHGGLHPRDVLVSVTETAIVGVGIAPILERVGVKLPVRRPYTAPEIVDGLVTSPAADQFSLAAIVFEWLYGRRIVGPAEGRIEVPEIAGVDRTAMAEAFTSALAMDPAVRFESSSAFIAALADAMEKTEVTPRPAPVRFSSRRPRPALTSIVPPLPDAARAAALLEEGPAELSGSRPVGASPGTIDDLDLGEGAPDDRRIPLPRSVTALRPTASRSPVSWVNVLTALVAAIVIGIATVYWLGLRPFADPNGRRLPDTSAAVPAPTASAPAGADASLPGAKSTTEPTPPTPAPEVVPAPLIPGEPAATGPSAAQAGRMLVRSTPAGAEVLVNGERRGVTPLALRELPFGPYLISVSRAGYSAQQHQVTLSAARPSQSLELTLVGGAGVSGGSVTSSTIAAPGATIGSLMIESRPVAATVFIDGRAAGITPIMLERLAPGAHAVRLERTGYQPWTTTVNVVPGELTRLAASLAGGQEQE
jgi:serine/threonine protein kinase